MKGPAKVMVAGGGIGGLTAAIALRRAGFEVVVFERTAELREIGAGLLLAANAQKRRSAPDQHPRLLEFLARALGA